MQFSVLLKKEQSHHDKAIEMLRSVIRHTVAHRLVTLMSVQLSDLFSITRRLYRLHRRVCQGLRLFVASDNHHTPTPVAVMLSLKKSVYTDLISEDKVPHWTSSRGTTNTENKDTCKTNCALSCKKSGGGLANPWISQQVG